MLPKKLSSQNDSDDFAIIDHVSISNDFEHLTIDNLSNFSNQNDERHEFDIINVNKQPQQPLQLISVKCGHIATKTTSDSPKSNSSTNATMEDIINLTEPLNSATGPSASNESSLSPLSEESKSLIIRTKIDSNKDKYREREYEIFISDKSVNAGCIGWFCLRWDSMQNNVKNTNFLDNATCIDIGSIANVVNDYMDKCFGADQFHSNKSLEKI